MAILSTGLSGPSMSLRLGALVARWGSCVGLAGLSPGGWVISDSWNALVIKVYKSLFHCLSGMLAQMEKAMPFLRILKSCVDQVCAQGGYSSFPSPTPLPRL